MLLVEHTNAYFKSAVHTSIKVIRNLLCKSNKFIAICLA